VLNVCAKYLPAPLDSEFLSRRIDEVNWGSRFNARIVHGCSYLARPEIVTIADLIKRDERELGRWLNFGARTIERIQQVLRVQGYELQSDPDYWAKEFGIRREKI
jgi:hypothetical protein